MGGKTKRKINDHDRPGTNAFIFIGRPFDSLPIDKGGHLPDAGKASGLKHYNPLENKRCNNRLTEIREFIKLIEDELFVVGWEYLMISCKPEDVVLFLLDARSHQGRVLKI
jgi:hypothetical protein